MTTINANQWDEVITQLVHGGVFPGVVNRALFWGVSQTGKSTTLSRLLNSERITFHSGMPIDDLIGGWTLQNGTTVWADGPATRCLRNGRTLQIDEINDIPMECKTALYALLDFPAGITLPSGERVNAAPGYAVVGTMNPNPNVLPEPIFERFDLVFKVETLSSGIKGALGPFAQQAERHVARQGVKLQWSRPMSIGLLMAAAKMRTAGMNDDSIAKSLGLTDVSAADFLSAITE